MHKLIYYVAVSLDGYIAGPKEDISAFTSSGSGVDQYLSDLMNFKTVIMGRKTYEFGYKYGLKPGQPAYPHMDHYIFSSSSKFQNLDLAENVSIEFPSMENVKRVLETAETDVYLCGGGQFAGWLLDHGMIDQLKLKLNPIVLGDGVKIFGESKTQANWRLISRKSHDNGLEILTYDFAE